MSGAAADLDFEVKKIVRGIEKTAISQADGGLRILRNAALEVLGKDGTGRSYKRGKKAFHVASAPGEPPAPDYGNLRKNWKQQKEIMGGVGAGLLRIVLKMKSRMEYFKYLEGGTRKMAQRPIVEPVKKLALPEIQALYSNL